MYAEEHENELQQINLRNEVTNQITVDTCGELQLGSAGKSVE